MNQQNLTLMGRATHEPEVLESKAGKQFTKFSLAVNRFRGKDEDAEVTFYEVVSFGKQSKSASKRIKKGDVILVHGTPQLQSYLSKNGEARAKITVKAEYVYPYTKPKNLEENVETSEDSAMDFAKYPSELTA